jgi:prophage maintenance system killer protein
VNLLMGHCLTDGNKRLAWICLTLALARIDCDLEADDEAAERLCLDVVTRHLDHARCRSLGGGADRADRVSYRASERAARRRLSQG